jgi:hypothetical protein
MLGRRVERCGLSCSVRTELRHAVAEALVFVVRAEREYDRASTPSRISDAAK